MALSATEQAMVKHMTVKADADTHSFCQFESVDFQKLQQEAAKHGVTPPALLVHHLAVAVERCQANKKLSRDRRAYQFLEESVDIGVAVDGGCPMWVAQHIHTYASLL